MCVLHQAACAEAWPNMQALSTPAQQQHTLSARNFRMRSLGSSALGDSDSSVASASRFQVVHVPLKAARPVLLA
jgi:hypothetical protein